MFIVLNKCYGGFSVSDSLASACGTWSHDEDLRFNPIVISAVQQDSEAASGYAANLEVVEIPDNATDYEIDEYDGYETVTYVQNGKLFHL